MGKKKTDQRHGPMSKQTLTNWRASMGYDIRDAAFELGCTQAELRAWEAGEMKIPRYIGLACSALALDMHPYGEESK